MQSTAVSKRNILAAVIGNALEWYDFLVFAFMTPIVAKLFFPSNPNDPSDDLNRILMTTAVFGVGFFMRPVGGILLGLYGDRKGRKAAMVMVTGIMAVAIALITFAPAPLYGPHMLTTAAWAMTPLEDQQAAGLIMWAPAAALYLVAALWRLGRWIGPDQPRVSPT